MCTLHSDPPALDQNRPIAFALRPQQHDQSRMKPSLLSLSSRIDRSVSSLSSLSKIGARVPCLCFTSIIIEIQTGQTCGEQRGDGHWKTRKSTVAVVQCVVGKWKICWPSHHRHHSNDQLNPPPHLICSHTLLWSVLSLRYGLVAKMRFHGKMVSCQAWLIVAADVYLYLQ